MHIRRWILLVAAIPLMGCNMRHETSDRGQSLSPERKAAVEAMCGILFPM